MGLQKARWTGETMSGPGMNQTYFEQRPAVFLCQAYDSLREALEVVLGDRYHVTAVNRIEALLSLLKDSTPDLLVIDIDGQPPLPECLSHVRQSHDSFQVLLMAGQFSLEQQLAALQLVPNVGFIQKPFSLESFLEKVETLLRGYSTSGIRQRIVRIALS